MWAIFNSIKKWLTFFSSGKKNFLRHSFTRFDEIKLKEKKLREFAGIGDDIPIFFEKHPSNKNILNKLMTIIMEFENMLETRVPFRIELESHIVFLKRRIKDIYKDCVENPANCEKFEILCREQEKELRDWKDVFMRYSSKFKIILHERLKQILEKYSSRYGTIKFERLYEALEKMIQKDIEIYTQRGRNDDGSRYSNMVDKWTDFTKIVLEDINENLKDLNSLLSEDQE